MVFRDRDMVQDYDFERSLTDALNPRNLMKRILLFLVFGFVLSVRVLVQNLDKVGQAGGGVFEYIKAISSAIWHGIYTSLGSLWVVIINPQHYIQTHSYGSLFVAVFFLVVLVFFFYQPISVIINILDGRRGEVTGIALRVFVTVIVVIILSSIIYYVGGGEIITTTFFDKLGNNIDVNNTINSNVIDNINQTKGSIIDLI